MPSFIGVARNVTEDVGSAIPQLDRIGQTFILETHREGHEYHGVVC
jgi:hypothetical protein